MTSRVLRKKNKTVSFLSHEYVIANHGDLVSMVAMVFIAGLMFKRTTPIAGMFIIMQHNTTVMKPIGPPDLMYTAGMLDCLAVFFYTLVAIILHAVIQEYILDKLSRKLHLAKSQLSKFNESSQLLFFFALSGYAIGYMLFNENIMHSFSDLWEGYPHVALPFWLKIFFIFQMSYWVHTYPELYFQKVRKDEIANKMFIYTLYLLGCVAAYVMSFTRVALVIMLVHYFTDCLVHAARVVHWYGYPAIAKVVYSIWNAAYIPVRIFCTVVAFLTFYYGLDKSTVKTVSVTDANYNTFVIRLNCLMFVFLTQAYMVWRFVTFHQKRLREQTSSKFLAANYATNADFVAQKKKDKKKGKRDDDDIGDLPEVDQNSHRELRQRKSKVRNQ